MRNTYIRTWKSRDVQGLAPRAWCRVCGRELYTAAPRDGLCGRCRRQMNRRFRKGAGQ